MLNAPIVGLFNAIPCRQMQTLQNSTGKAMLTIGLRNILSTRSYKPNTDCFEYESSSVGLQKY